MQAAPAIPPAGGPGAAASRQGGATDGPTELLDRVWSDRVDPVLAAPLLECEALN